jgi:hypothetical protein
MPETQGHSELPVKLHLILGCHRPLSVGLAFPASGDLFERLLSVKPRVDNPPPIAWRLRIK